MVFYLLKCYLLTAVLFKSLRNSKRRNEGNVTPKQEKVV